MPKIGILRIAKDDGVDTDNGPLCEQGILVEISELLIFFKAYHVVILVVRLTEDLISITSTSTTLMLTPSRTSIARE